MASQHLAGFRFRIGEEMFSLSDGNQSFGYAFGSIVGTLTQTVNQLFLDANRSGSTPPVNPGPTIKCYVVAQIYAQNPNPQETGLRKQLSKIL